MASQTTVLNGVFTQATNAYNGVNVGQPVVTSSGSVAVPNVQAGNGIFSQLFTIGSGLVTKYIQDRGVKNVQVQSPPAAAVGGAGLVGTSSGGVVITLPGPNNGGVTDPNQNTGNKMPAWLMPVALIVAGFLLVMMFFKKRRR